MAIWMIDYYSASTVSKTDITYSAFMKHVQQDEVKQVTIVDNVISGKLKDGKDFSTVAPSDDSLIPTLRARDIEIKSRAAAAAALVDDYLKLAFADAFDRRYLVYADAAKPGGRRPGYEFRQEPCPSL